MGGFLIAYNSLGDRLLESPFGFSQASSGAIAPVDLLGGPASAGFGRLGSRGGRGRTMMAAVVLLLLQL